MSFVFLCESYSLVRQVRMREGVGRKYTPGTGVDKNVAG